MANRLQVGFDIPTDADSPARPWAPEVHPDMQPRTRLYRVALDRIQRPLQRALSVGNQRRILGLLLWLCDTTLLLLILGVTLPWHRIAWDPLWMASASLLVAIPLLSLYVVGGYWTEAVVRTGRARDFAAAGFVGVVCGLILYKLVLLWPLQTGETARFSARALASPFVMAAWAVLARWLARRLVLRSEARGRIIMICQPALSAQLQQVVQASHRNSPCVALDRDAPDVLAAVDRELAGRVRAVVLDQPGTQIAPGLLEALVHARLAGVPMVAPGELIEELQERTPVGLGDPARIVDDPRLRRGSAVYLALKRVSDLLVTIPLLVLLLPVMLAVAAAVRLTSPGPVFFLQRREGLYKRPFTIIKFRTMRTDAERNGAQWASANDPRVTPIGAFLRKSRLDELPQLVNVIRGTMSLVGPRPERPEFSAMLVEYIPWYDLRHLAKPGLTGWAQVRYPYGASLEDAVAKLEFEIYYLKHASLAFDLRILMRTLSVVLGLRGR